MFTEKLIKKITLVITLIILNILLFRFGFDIFSNLLVVGVIIGLLFLISVIYSVATRTARGQEYRVTFFLDLMTGNLYGLAVISFFLWLASFSFFQKDFGTGIVGGFLMVSGFVFGGGMMIRNARITLQKYSVVPKYTNAKGAPYIDNLIHPRINLIQLIIAVACALAVALFLVFLSK